MAAWVAQLYITPILLCHSFYAKLIISSRFTLSLTKVCNHQSLTNIPVPSNYSNEVCTCIQSPLYLGWSLSSGTILVQRYGNFIIIQPLFIVLIYQRWLKLNIIIIEPLYQCSPTIGFIHFSSVRVESLGSLSLHIYHIWAIYQID